MMDDKPYICSEMKHTFTTLLLVVLFSSMGTSQSVKDSSIFTTQVSLSYAAQIPEGDLKNRFGWNSNIGFNVDIKLASNWVLGINSQFFFGNQVKDTSMLTDMYTSNGQIINQNGAFANVLAYERGWIFTGNIGKIFPIIGPNPNSGILFKFGVGFIQHKVRIEAEQDLVPQFTGEYSKLYDRYTNGLVLTQFIGYSHMGNKGLANFFAGIDLSEGFTRGRRLRQAGAETEVNKSRTDLLMGLRAGWIVPIRKRPLQDFYLN
jgi:hypothetical protein